MDKSSGIDISRETLLSFSEASRWLPKNSNGKTIHLAVFWRWAAKGLKDAHGNIVKLEITEIGGRSCTSREALQRFFDRLRGPDAPRLLFSSRRHRGQWRTTCG